MHKKLIAIAVAGLATSGAMAQTNVTISGKVDLGIAHYTGTSGATGVGRGSQTRMESGFANGASKIVFTGSENLGGGMRLDLTIDTAVTADGGTGQAALAGGPFVGARESSLALVTSIGTIKAGRFGNAGADWYVASYDPFADNGFVCGSCLMDGGMIGTTSNTIRYASPVMSGFVVMYDYAMSENQDKVNATTSGSQSVLSVAYNNGPLSLMATQMITRDVNTTTRGRNLTTNGLGASYDFGAAKLMGQMWTEKTTLGTTAAGITEIAPATNQRHSLLGISVPVGPHSFLASYRIRDSRLAANQDVKSWTLGYAYAMSKRTSLHAYGSQLKNTNNAAAQFGGTAVAGSGGTTGYFGGISHTF